MNLLGNGDRPIAKLGETLTGVSINKPLIRKKEAERSNSSNSTGGEYQWHDYICMQAQHCVEGLGLTGALPMALAHLSIPDSPWQRACPLFDCAVNPVHPPLSPCLPSKCSSGFFHLLSSNQLIFTVPRVCRCAL